eukprot:222510-Rhodomonas_salina.1
MLRSSDPSRESHIGCCRCLVCVSALVAAPRADVSSHIRMSSSSSSSSEMFCLRSFRSPKSDLRPDALRSWRGARRELWRELHARGTHCRGWLEMGGRVGK